MCNPEQILDKHALPIVDNFNLNEASSNTIHINCLISGSSQRKDSLLEIFNETIIEEQTKYSYHVYVIKSLKKDSQIFFQYFIQTKVLMLKRKKKNSFIPHQCSKFILKLNFNYFPLFTF